MRRKPDAIDPLENLEARPGAQQSTEISALDIADSPFERVCSPPDQSMMSNQNEGFLVDLAKATGSPKGTAPIWQHLSRDPTIEERFWSLVEQRGPDECWDWKGASRDDYGRFKIAGESRQSNRVAWAIANRRDPGYLLVRHTCDRPQCCNPAHLLLGTVKDNSDDKISRGRAGSVRGRGVISRCR